MKYIGFTLFVIGAIVFAIGVIVEHRRIKRDDKATDSGKTDTYIENKVNINNETVEVWSYLYETGNSRIIVSKNDDLELDLDSKALKLRIDSVIQTQKEWCNKQYKEYKEYLSINNNP